MGWSSASGGRGARYKRSPKDERTYRGILFDSKKEMCRWIELQLLERGNEIRGLERQKRFPLVVNGRQVCTYVADFAYEERETRTVRELNRDFTTDYWVPVVEDSKGHRTEMFRLKARLMRACLSIEVRET